MEDRYFALDHQTIGEMWVAHRGGAVTAIRRRDAEPAIEQWYRTVHQRPVVFEETADSRLTQSVLRALDGGPPPPLDLEGLPDFQRRVLQRLLEIPRGTTRTYGAIASEVGSPGAARAVGTAVARNPICYVVPCHRVVRGTGVIGEYGAGGPAEKRRLLAWEGVAGVR